MSNQLPTKEVYFTRIFERIRDSRAKVVINVGGARSSKSYSICQLLIMKMLQEKNKTIGICRKTFPALRMTCLKLFFDLLVEYGIYNENNHNKTFNSYAHTTETDGKKSTTLVQFFGLDESEKIKSTEFNYIWMEEANEFTYEDYTNLKLRLSGQTTPNQPNHLYLSLNPIDANGWIPMKAVKENDVELIHSTFMDNPFLSEDYKKLLTDLIYQDQNYYRVYALGEWGHLERRVYTNYRIIPAMPDLSNAKWAYGLDFGLVNPSALVKVYLLNGKFYLEERLYRSGMTNADIIEFLSHEQRGDIYGDPSAKQMLAEIQQAGYTAHEGHKGVKEGIDLCQRSTLFIPEASVNLIKEIEGYQWRADPNMANASGSLPEPVKFNDHACDAFRYAVFGLTMRYGYATAMPNGTQPIETLHFPRSQKNNLIPIIWR